VTRIAVVSDTHLPRFGLALPTALRQGIAAAHVDLIAHLGDFTGPEVPALLEALGPLEAVAGNNDPPELVRRYGRRKVIDLGGRRVGLTHGDLGHGSSTLERAVATFAADDVDVILFGHSHIPLMRRVPNDRWLVNPGSPTDKRRQPRYSWALVTIGPDGTIDAELRFFDDRTAASDMPCLTRPHNGGSTGQR
jgi:uncharacterized protein